jgi:hypothetical protein
MNPDPVLATPGSITLRAVRGVEEHLSRVNEARVTPVNRETEAHVEAALPTIDLIFGPDRADNRAPAASICGLRVVPNRYIEHRHLLVCVRGEPPHLLRLER